MPSLSRLGKLTFAGGIGLTMGGLLGAVDPLLGAGQGVLVGLALAWVATTRLPRRMRRERLEFTWWVPARAQGVRRPDEAIPVKMAVRNPTDGELVLSTPRLALSPGLRHARWKHQRIVVPPRSMAAFELELRASHAGRHVLHGAWMTLAGPFGLAWAPLYFPNPLVVQVQTRSAGGAALARANARPEPSARAGRATRRVGEGPEIRELRDHQPGDPFRRIAWKASARKGRLLVRDTEDEAQTTRMLVVDVSSTMRGNDSGLAKIDYAIELVAQSARITAAGGDRIGLVAFDSRVVAVVPPGSDPAHVRTIVGTAVDLRSIVDEDLTNLDDEALVQTVARYFREQEGVDVFRGQPYFESRRRLAEMAGRAVRNDPMMKQAVGARDPTARVLRAFCRARAIALPLKHDPTGAAKINGLASALRHAIEGARESRTILVVSDLDPITDVSGLKNALAQARAKRHRVTVVAPSGEDFLRKPRTDRPELIREDTSDAVKSVFTRDEASRLRELRPVLATMGVPLYLARARDPAARWLRRAASPHVR